MVSGVINKISYNTIKKNKKLVEILDEVTEEEQIKVNPSTK
ncbi:MAG: hypothetical protein AABY14_01480 [Nanoarchaeota archaeon]